MGISYGSAQNHLSYHLSFSHTLASPDAYRNFLLLTVTDGQWLPEAGEEGERNGRRESKGTNFQSKASTGATAHTALYTCKLLREKILKAHHEKKKMLQIRMGMDGN